MTTSIILEWRWLPWPNNLIWWTFCGLLIWFALVMAADSGVYLFGKKSKKRRRSKR
jgi:hypothetical protein